MKPLPHPRGNQTRGSEPRPGGLGRGVAASGPPGRVSALEGGSGVGHLLLKCGGSDGDGARTPQAAWFLLPHQHLSVLLLKHIRDLAGLPGGPDGKRLSAMRETRVRSPGREDHLEKEMAAHSSTVAWRIPWSEMSGGLPCTGSRRVGHD